MLIPINEVNQLHKELKSIRKDNPIWYEAGKNIVRIERALKKVDEIYNAERQVIIDQFAKKDAKGGYIYVFEPDQQTGKAQQAYDFGDNKSEAVKLLQDLHGFTYVKDPAGNEIKIEVDIFKAKKENGDKLKEMDFSGLAYVIEYLDI